MTHSTISLVEHITWQDELREMITNPKTLLQALDLPLESYLEQAEQAAKLFPLRVTRSFLANMEKGNIEDPLLLQVLPLLKEHDINDGFVDAPLKEEAFNPAPGLIHKYAGRVLLIAAQQCAIHCRYCFRRNFDYAANAPSRAQWQEALTYIDNDPSIDEVILSGGDPLTLSDTQILWLTKEISAIAHVTRLRIHTRLPIVLPSRITDNLIHTLSNSRLKIVIVIHSNHANELSLPVNNALRKLKDARFTLLNQTVLLKGINDSSDALCDLSYALFNQGVMPYYLHALDKVNGAAHFDTKIQQAQALHKHMRERLSGYLVPKLVQETPFARSKVPI